MTFGRNALKIKIYEKKLPKNLHVSKFCCNFATEIEINENS